MQAESAWEERRLNFVVRPLTWEDAQAIAAWHYEGIYAFYDMDQDPEDLAQLLDPASWADGYADQTPPNSYRCFGSCSSPVS